MMTFSDFIAQFDVEGSVVLLEGKRKVMPEDAPKLKLLGKLLASQTKHMLFRSGNADGSDQLFSEGVASIDPRRLQNIIPYNGHRKKTNVAYQTISLEDVNIAGEDKLVYQSINSHPKMKGLIENYVGGAIDKNSIKAAYILRDTAKVLGLDGSSPATFGLFYDDLNHRKEGGTGHTMRVCELNKVPFLDQTTWFIWL